MIFGNPKNIAITYEVLERQPNSHFAFGTFNIFIDDRLLLSGGSNWTIDCLVSYLRNTKKITEIHDERIHKDVLFNIACVTRGYLLHDSRQINSEWWGSDDPTIVKQIADHLAEIDSLRTVPPVGLELPLYSELVDKNLRIFIFASATSERIIYSLDNGIEVIEKIVAKDTVSTFCMSLPKVV